MRVAEDVGKPGREPEARSFQWTLALLPAFPIVLLVLRLWHLGRQDLNTMLVLVQNVGPLDLVSALVISTMWVPPVVLLTGHALGLLYQVSAPARAAKRPTWLTRTADATPDWAIGFTVMWAALTWQLRFLPALAMAAVVILALTVRKRHPEDGRRIRVACLYVPLVAAAATYPLVWPAITSAVSHGEITLALVLALPPVLTLALTGPIPERIARPVIHAPATAVALAGPFVLLAIFLRTPVLPSVAIQLEALEGESAEVVLGYVVAVDDTVTTLLDDSGTVRFVPNTAVEAKVLCAGAESVPYSEVDLHGWHVEESLMEWYLPDRDPGPTDEVRCAGRPR
ncbi:hypothetical protein [Actinophytocola sp.]|uniref:hypothetical protein n=1 Tax=Actinophytocola sp. TaxID=1872138 RepID=UPI002ED5C5B2